MAVALVLALGWASPADVARAADASPAVAPAAAVPAQDKMSAKPAATPAKGAATAAVKPVDALRLELQGRIDEQTQAIESLRSQAGTLDERLGKLSQDVGVNATSIKELRNTLDDTAKKIFNNLIGETGNDASEEVAGRLDRIEARLGLRRAKGAPVPDQPPASAVPEAAPVAPSGHSTVSSPPAPPAGGDGHNPPAQTSGSGSPAAGSETAGHGEMVSRAPLMAGVSSLEILTAALLVLLLLPALTLLELSAVETWAWPQAGLRNLVTGAAAVLAYFVVGYPVMFGTMPFAQASAQVGPEEAASLYQLCLALVAPLLVASMASNRLSVPASAFTAVVVAGFAYPALGHWCWASLAAPDRPGWLEKQGFRDFAGASVILSFSAWFAFAWVWRLPMARPLSADEQGSRGLFLAPFALFLLGLGWFGLVAKADGAVGFASARPLVNLILAGAGALVASLSYLLIPVGRRSDDTVLARYPAGALAGLVAVSAGADRFMPVEALVIGILAGLLQVLAYQALAAKLVRGDQVAANLIASFGVCGFLGTLGVGIFGTEGTFSAADFAQLGVQGLGAAVTLAFGLTTGLATTLTCEAFTLLAEFRQGQDRQSSAWGWLGGLPRRGKRAAEKV